MSLFRIIFGSKPKLISSILKNRNYCGVQEIYRLHSALRLEAIYRAVKQKCDSKKLPKDVDIKAVFACNELDLKEVKVYGFDYDYTLACYKPSMEFLLYNLARQILIEKHRIACNCKNTQREFVTAGMYNFNLTSLRRLLPTVM